MTIVIFLVVVAVNACSFTMGQNFAIELLLWKKGRIFRKET